MIAPIESLHNLGPKSVQWLSDAEIATITYLERLGPVVAYRLVKQRQPQPAVGIGGGHEGQGLAGKDWLELTSATKNQLRKEATHGDQ